MSGTVLARRHGRWFDLLATIGIGVVVVGAALVPAVTASSGEEITLRGDVRMAGQPLQFFPVGYWTPDGVVTVSRTDAKGDFSLDVPATLDGYAYAGTAPDDDRAILSVAGQDVVRGVIGRTVPDGVSTPLYQGWDAATGRSLKGGPDALHFVLEPAGRIRGTSPVVGTGVRAVQVRRLDGSVVSTLTLDARGRYTSPLLVPGDYLVALVPASPMLPTTAAVTVGAGTTVIASPPAPQTGGQVDGRVTVDGDAAPSGVPVLLQQEGRTIARTQTASGGAYRFSGLAAGSYDVEVGVFADEQPASVPPSSVEVPLPSATATPTPSETPTPTPSPTQAAVPQTIERTTDAGLPATSTAVVTPGLTTSVSTDLEPAGRVGGTVRGTAGVATQVVALDSSTGRIVRSTTAGAGGRYSVGGLVPGDQYRIWAITRPEDQTLSRIGGTTGLATASTTGVDVTIERPADSLQGTVAGVTGGTVTLGDEAVFARTGAIDASGAYLLQGLVPGTFAVTVQTGGRIRSAPVAATLQPPATTGDEDQDEQDASGVDTTLDLQPGPTPATFTGWFISGGAGVTHVSGTATSTTGAVADLGPLTRAGHLTVGGLEPGTYTYDQDSFAGTVPALDGPWWFAAPTGSFVLSDGAERDVGPVVLHVRAR